MSLKFRRVHFQKDKLWNSGLLNVVSLISDWVMMRLLQQILPMSHKFICCSSPSIISFFSWILWRIITSVFFSRSALLMNSLIFSYLNLSGSACKSQFS